MKDLKEISNYMLSDLSEGLLSGMEETIDAGDRYMDEETIKPWFTNDKCKMTKKKNGYLLRGNFKINNIDTAHYNGPKIVGVVGNLAISGTKLESLEGLFDVTCSVEGTFTIENNDNLVSLKGCPISVGTLVVANNKNLTNIDIAPNVLVNAYFSKNGKKFKEEQLRKTVNVYKRIYCSVESDESLVVEGIVNEAFKAPQLKLVADAIKRMTPKELSRHNRFKFNNISEIAWDKIEASQVSEYDMSDPKSMTAARGLVYKNATGMYILVNKEGNVYAFIYNKHLMLLEPTWRNKTIERWSSGTKMSNQDILDSIANADSFMFVDLAGMDYVWKLQSDRREARKGALAYQKGEERTNNPNKWNDMVTSKNVRYYQEIANDNRERYQKLVTQLKAQRAILTGNFNKIKVRLDSVFSRYTTLLSKIYQNPTKYPRYELAWLNDKFHTYSQRDRYTIREYGLFEGIEMYFNYIIEASKGGNISNRNDISAKIRQLEDNLNIEINSVERKLRQLEAL